MTAADAAQVADTFSAAMTAQIKSAIDASPMYAQWLINANIYQAVHDGKHYSEPMPSPPSSHKAQREIMFIAQDAGVRRLWQRNRIVYSIDPDLWAELGHTDVSTEIPEGLFDRLPHADPFIALPTPLILPLDDEVRQRVVGFYVIGRGQSLTETQVSTHSPAAVGNIGLLIGGLVESYDGKPLKVPGMGGVQDMIWTRATLRRSARTVQEMLDSIQANFNAAPEAGGFEGGGTVESVVACVSMLIYLCSVNAELRPLPASVSKRQAKGVKAKPPKIIEVGYETGAALRAYRRAEQAERTPGSGRSVRPHIRRAHFHTYRVGAGRVDSIVKWLSPIPIKVQGDAVKSTVVKVS